ncbi:MAG TPA: riboflavin synthase [Bacillales bacterium]|nr:riboflavin synthase [Bacillales bacterium]
MFTGIVEEMGKIARIERGDTAFRMTIQANLVLEDLNVGDSVSVNGVCLTVTRRTGDAFEVDVMPETVKATGFQTAAAGLRVNLERSMAADGRFGGHFVSGHVDGTGEIVEKQPQENAVYYQIRTSEAIVRYLVMKGSVAVDGTSLTVFGVDNDTFTLALIPHTMNETVLGEKQVGDIVNIECDVVGKYIEKFTLNRTKEEGAEDV